MMERSAPTATWSAVEKIGFRFAFLFFVLFIVLLDWSTNIVFSLFYYFLGMAQLLDAVVGAVGTYAFGITDTIISPHDGQHNDRLYIYLLYVVMAGTALVGTVIWSVLDKRRADYRTLYYWLTTIVRYYLAFTLFLFALEKFFKMQFPDLNLFTLTQPVGEMTPMELAWAFFGYSGSYNVFMGLAESAPLLLLFRRTTTLGALLTMGTLANIIAVNFSYDVHAKMYPVAMFLMAAFLLLPQLQRLKRFFVDGDAVALKRIDAPELKTKRMKIAKIATKTVLIGSVLGVSISNYMRYWRGDGERAVARAEAGMAGVFDVNTFVVNRDTLADDDPTRWRTLYLGGSRERIRLQDDRVSRLIVNVDRGELQVYTDNRELALRTQEVFNELGASMQTAMLLDSIMVARHVFSRFRLESVDATTIRLTGSINGDSVFATAQRRPLQRSDFPLIRNGFHWVTE